MCLLDGINRITFVLQRLHGIQRLFIIRPLDTLFGTQRGLMDLCIRRTATDTAEHDAFDTHRIRRPEYRTHIMLAAHIIQHNYQRQLIRLTVLVDIHATHLSSRSFLAHKAKGKWT